jgi:hypothetical protein
VVKIVQSKRTTPDGRQGEVGSFVAGADSALWSLIKRKEHRARQKQKEKDGLAQICFAHRLNGQL